MFRLRLFWSTFCGSCKIQVSNSFPFGISGQNPLQSDMKSRIGFSKFFGLEPLGAFPAMVSGSFIARPSGKGAELEIWRFRVQVPHHFRTSWIFSNSSAELIQTQLICLLPVGILNLLFNSLVAFCYSFYGGYTSAHARQLSTYLSNKVL